MTCICVLTAFRPSFPHLETLKKILENSTLSRYVKKKKKKIPTDRPNFLILVGWGQHNIFFFWPNIVYMHVRPKLAPKCDFVYKINANWVFSLSSYKYAYFHSQLLKLISFLFSVLQKVSATNFSEKTTKTKGRKNKEIHKKFTKQ